MGVDSEARARESGALGGAMIEREEICVVVVAGRPADITERLAGLDVLICPTPVDDDTQLIVRALTLQAGRPPDRSAGQRAIQAPPSAT